MVRGQTLVLDWLPIQVEPDPYGDIIYTLYTVGQEAYCSWCSSLRWLLSGGPSRLLEPAEDRLPTPLPACERKIGEIAPMHFGSPANGRLLRCFVRAAIHWGLPKMKEEDES